MSNTRTRFDSDFEKPPLQLSARQFKVVILSALKLIHGDRGAAISVDVLKFSDNCRAYIRFPTK